MRRGDCVRGGAAAAGVLALLVAGCDPKTVPRPEPKTAPRVEQPGSAPRGGTTGAVQPDGATPRSVADSGALPPR
jgi:hypothetical protein